MFKPFELILFIGVAASRKKDIPIGSVIASDRIYYPHVGKYEGGSFHNRARLHNIGKDLKMLATWVIREDGWQDRILPTKGWQRPSDPKYDFLFTPIAKLRSEEHTSELQSLMRISFAVFCLKKKKKK